MRRNRSTNEINGVNRGNHKPPKTHRQGEKHIEVRGCQTAFPVAIRYSRTNVQNEIGQGLSEGQVVKHIFVPAFETIDTTVAGTSTMTYDTSASHESTLKKAQWPDTACRRTGEIDLSVAADPVRVRMALASV